LGAVGVWSCTPVLVGAVPLPPPLPPQPATAQATTAAETVSHANGFPMRRTKRGRVPLERSVLQDHAELEDPHMPDRVAG
jgi:hypothetical protein